MMVSFSATWLRGEVRLAVGQVAPDEDHGRAGRRRQQDQAGDVAVDLVGGQVGAEEPADEHRAQQRHGEGLHRPVDEQGDADAPPVTAHLTQGGEIDPHQHRDDHQPDQPRHRQVDVGELGRADRLERGGEDPAEGDPDDDAQADPQGQVALEQGHRRALGGDGAATGGGLGVRFGRQSGAFVLAVARQLAGGVERLPAHAGGVDHPVLVPRA
jgi:hypothetical protein